MATTIEFTPLGRATGKVCLQKPNTNATDLDFTRASTALEKNKDGLLESVAVNTPRYTFENGCPSLLLELQSTNLITYPISFNNPYWIKSGVTIDDNGGNGYSAPSVDYPTGAYKLVEDASTGQHQIQTLSISITIGSRYVQSFYIKEGERSIVQIALGSQFSGTDYANFDLSNGTVALEVGDVGAEIKELTNGWFRCSIYGTALATTTEAFYLSTQISETATRFDSYTGDGVSGVYVFGAQVENHLNVTSLMLPVTEGSTTTRLADVCSKTGLSGLLGSQISAIIEVDLTTLDLGITRRLFSLNNGSTSKRVNCYLSTGDLVVMYVQDTTAQAQIQSPLITETGILKIGIKAEENNFALWVNGVEVGTDLSGTMPVISQLDLGNELGNTILNDGIKQFQLYQEILTDAEFLSKTTL